MKVMILAIALLATAFAASPNEPIPIVSQDAEVNFDGSFHSSYETGNGIGAQEQGALKNAGQKDEAAEVQGAFHWTAPDGQTFSVKYIANENGFQPEAAHLPVAPEPLPIPEAILRSIQWNEAHPEPEVKIIRNIPL